jgi:putative transposase
MPNTYTQLYVQFVFAVQNRASLIAPNWEEELYKYITGIVQNNRHKMIAINGIPNHLHIMVGINPTQSISNFMKLVKGESSEWINDKGFNHGQFSWQEGYGAFSYSRSQIDSVYKYIMDQKLHHQRQSFLDEYVQMLEAFGIKYDRRYIFKEVEDRADDANFS